jgi:hypothetical protein
LNNDSILDDGVLDNIGLDDVLNGTPEESVDKLVNLIENPPTQPEIPVLRYGNKKPPYPIHEEPPTQRGKKMPVKTYEEPLTQTGEQVPTQRGKQPPVKTGKQALIPKKTRQREAKPMTKTGRRFAAVLKNLTKNR